MRNLILSAPTLQGLFFLLLGFSNPVVTHAAPLELDILRQQYDKTVNAPFAAGKVALDNKYATALEKWPAKRSQ